MPLQVFPPLTLEPRNITLIIGAKFQVQVFGGPQQQQDSTIEFLMSNTRIATSNTVGLITASTLGSTKLVGRVYGTDRMTSKRVVFSEDTIFVHVIKLEGIRIRAPVHLVQSGMELPLYAVGVDIENQVRFFEHSINNKVKSQICKVCPMSPVASFHVTTRFSLLSFFPECVQFWFCSPLASLPLERFQPGGG